MEDTCSFAFNIMYVQQVPHSYLFNFYHQNMLNKSHCIYSYRIKCSNLFIIAFHDNLEKAKKIQFSIKNEKSKILECFKNGFLKSFPLGSIGFVLQRIAK